MGSTAVPRDQLKQVWQNRQPNNGFVKAGVLVRAFIKSQGLDRASPLAALGEIWRELVGQELSRHSWVEGLRRGTLRIAVDSAAHMAELQALVRAGLCASLSERFTERPVSAIRLRLGFGDARTPQRDRR